MRSRILRTTNAAVSFLERNIDLGFFKIVVHISSKNSWEFEVWSKDPLSKEPHYSYHWSPHLTDHRMTLPLSVLKD